ncbi:MAG: hypothetical protein RLZZ15_4457 [Verrucomicrobiota bacterium]|jgi:hypothetical protein
MSDAALIALDATVLLGLAEDNSAAWHAVKLLREQVEGSEIVVTPAAIIELALVVERLPAGEPVRGLAVLALRSLRGEWAFREVDAAAFDAAALDRHAAALALLEAAALPCRLLVTWDPDLTALPVGKLRTFLRERSLHPLRVASPLAVAQLYAAGP